MVPATPAARTPSPRALVTLKPLNRTWDETIDYTSEDGQRPYAWRVDGEGRRDMGLVDGCPPALQRQRLGHHDLLVIRARADDDPARRRRRVDRRLDGLEGRRPAGPVSAPGLGVLGDIQGAVMAARRGAGGGHPRPLREHEAGDRKRRQDRARAAGEWTTSHVSSLGSVGAGAVGPATARFQQPDHGTDLRIVAASPGSRRSRALA